MARKRVVGKDRRCWNLGGCWHDDKHRQKYRDLRLWTGIGSRNQLRAALACKKGEIDARTCVFDTGEYRCPVLVQEPLDCQRGSAVGSVMDWFKPDVAICPKTEDRAERLPEWD